VNPPESTPNTMLVTSRQGGTKPTKCRFPVICKCISKGTILSTMRLLKWKEKTACLTQGCMVCRTITQT